MEKSFVDKVYDAYIKEDYKYGDNNLNPKREIRKMSIKDTDDMLNKILAGIQAKVTEISKKYPTKDFDMDNITGNFGGSGRNTGLPSSVKQAISRAGGNGNMVLMIPNMDGSTTPLMVEVEMTLAKILTTIGNDPTDTDENGIPIDNIKTSGPDLFTIDCSGTYNIITGGENSNSDDDDSDNSDSNSDDDNDNDDSDNDGDDSENGGGTSTSNKSGTDSTDSSDSNGADNASDVSTSADDSVDATVESLVNDALSKIDDDISNSEANAKQCALKDLGLMRAFLAILKIIQALKKAINPLLNTLFDTIKIVVLAAGCWNNPTNISEIIQRIVVKIMAIMVMIIAKLVQMFWEMLGLDCLSEQSKDVIDQIKEALTDVSSTYNQCTRLAMSFGSNVEQLTDAFVEAKDAIDEAIQNTTTDKIKDMFDLTGVANKIYNDTLGGIDGIKEAGKSAIESTGAYQDILETIEDVKSLRKTAQSTIDSILKSNEKARKSADQTVRKIATQLHNVRVK